MDRHLTHACSFAHSLPRIENALPGRDGYEVEIFGMEGIPAPDVADYKRRKEIELGLSAGTISQPQPKRAKTENRPLTEAELRAQLEAHKALMSGGSLTAAPVVAESTPVYGAAPTTYAVPVPPAPGITPPVAYPTPPFPIAPPVAGTPPFPPPFVPPVG